MTRPYPQRKPLPNSEEILRAAKQAGSVAGAAKSFNLSRATLYNILASENKRITLALEDITPVDSIEELF